MTTDNAVPVIRMRRGAVGYGDRPVIHDVDLDVHRGDVVALLGANGSGKTTLVRGILGLAPLVAGELELFGVPAGRFRQRYRIGYVPQRHTVIGGIPSTVREVVASGRLPRKGLWTRSTEVDRAAVERAIATVLLSEKAGRNVGELSGGQQRRVLIARALAAEPDVLVLDEPTAGVDAANQLVLAATLERLIGVGSTLLLVAHELGPLEPLIGRVVLMSGGRVSYDGPPTDSLRARFAGGFDAAHGHEHEHGQAPERPGLRLSGRDVV